jgi:TRAP transporter TAXI family solute receptor
MGQMVVRADSAIRTLADLKGKSVAVGLPGGSAGHMWEVLFRLHGVDPAKGEVKTHYLEYNRALDQIANGQLDATHVYGGIPQAGLFNASRSNKLRYLSLDPGSLSGFARAMPNGEWYVYRELSPEMIKTAYGEGFDVTGTVYNWAFPMMLVARADMPEDVAYTLVKELWDNIEEVKKNNTQLKDLSLDKALEKVSAEIHPGALRYFREKGLALPKS